MLDLIISHPIQQLPLLLLRGKILVEQHRVERTG
jgi:hypothetical protein